ncbi:MAG TPA: hypothetical protein VIM84_11855 [Gemmatimonadales bacterium]
MMATPADSASRLYHYEDAMASTRKSAKRSSRKKGKTTKRAAARKRPARKAAARRRGKASGTLKRRAKRGLAVAREGIDTVRQAGERTWETLKSTTAHVVEGVRERLGEESGPGRSYP